MADIPQVAFIRFRSLGECYRQTVAVENDVRRRLSDAIQRHRALQAERVRLAEPAHTSFGVGARLHTLPPDAAKIAQCEALLKTAKAEIARLEDEVVRAEARKSDAGGLLGRCSNHLLDLGAQRRDLEY